MRTGESVSQLRRFITVALTLFTSLAGVLVILFALLVPLYLTTVPSGGFTSAEKTWLVAAGALSLGNAIIARALNAVLWAQDRQDIERKSNVGGVLLRAVGYLVVAGTGGGLSAVVLAEFAGSCVTPVVCGFVVLRRVGHLDFARDGFTRFAPGLLRLGATLFVGSMSLVVSYQAPLYLVGSNLGLTATTAFGALIRVYQSARLVNSWMANPFIHGISTDTGDALRVACRNALGLTVAVGATVAVILAALAQDLTVAWLGAPFAFAASATAVISLGILADAIVQPCSLMTNLRGSPKRLAVLHMTNLVGVLIATSAAVRTGSLTWVMAAATLVPVALAPLYLREAGRSTGTVPWHGLGRWMPRTAGGLGLGGAVIWTIGRVLAPWPAVLTVGLITGSALGVAVVVLRRRRASAAARATLGEVSSSPASDAV